LQLNWVTRLKAHKVRLDSSSSFFSWAEKYIVALAYVMHKTPYVFPIIGGRKVEHLKSNIRALELKLTDEQMKSIDSTLPFDLGFPSNFVVRCVPSLCRTIECSSNF
jgi:hypothetical protein